MKPHKIIINVLLFILLLPFFTEICIFSEKGGSSFAYLYKNQCSEYSVLQGVLFANETKEGSENSSLISGSGKTVIHKSVLLIFITGILILISAAVLLFIILLRRQVKNRTEALQRETYLNYYIADLSRKLIADVSMDNISKVVLEYLTELTSSRHGLAGYIEKNGSEVLSPFFFERNGDDFLFRKVTIKAERINTLMLSVLEKKEVFFTNDMDEIPLLVDMPESHIELQNFISSPALISNEAVGFILLANSDKGYGNSDVNIIENFASQYALAIQRMWFEHELIGSERKYRDMFNNVADLLYIYDLNGTLVETNKSFETLFGYSQEEIRKMNIIEMLTEGNDNIYKRESVKSLLDKIVSRGYLNGEVEIRRKSGEKVVLEFKNSVIRDESGRPIGVRGSARDITDRKIFEKVLIEAKEKASDSDRLKSNFIANMSHEIRTPLNAILGFTDMLIEEAENPVHKNYLGMIQSSGKLLLSIIDDILDLSKIESGAMKISAAPVNVKKIMQNAYSRGTVLLKNKPEVIQLITDVDEAIPDFIYGDEYRIEQVLNNLLMNAVKFTTRGRIKLGLKLRNDYTLEFFVEDTGIGIAPDNIKMIFERFRQVDGDSRRSYGGTGLGLAISKMIVELMGGNIYVKSEPGSGSKFIFTVPYRPAFENVEKTQERTQEKKSRGNRILVVEDNAINRTLVTRVLEKRGYVTHIAVNGFEAVDAVKNGEPVDLILMDIQMPGMDGMEALKHIRDFEKETGREKGIPVIALSAHVMKEDVDKFLGSGFDSYVAKPFNSNDLIARIESFL